MPSRRRAALADLLGLSFILFVLADYLRPSLLLLPSITAGGDTPCHYPTAAWFHEHLLPRLRFHGWYPGSYLGHPLLLYYFPLPFLVMSALAPAVGLPAAFKLGTVLGVFLLPLLTYTSLRLMGFRFPAPLLGTAAATIFLFLEENPIWGGTIASTLTGEFSYTYGLGLGVLFLGVCYRTYARGDGPWLPAALLGLTALAHGYAVLWAGLSASYFLITARRPARTLRWLLMVAGLAFALAGFWVLPLLADWGWTTPYDDPWITVAARNLVPQLLWPLFIAAGAGTLVMLATARRAGGPDHRLLFLLYSAVVGAALAAAGPALGIIDVRFVPFVQLAVCLAGGVSVGLAVQRLAAADLAALGLAVLGILQADTQSKVLRSWIDWNYTGLEAREHWPAFREVSRLLRGTVGDPRVAVEYGAEHERAGSIRMYETIPFFSGRSTLEGVYNQASLQTHFVYYLASELGASSPNPFRRKEYSTFDTESALRHLALFHTGDVVAVSPRLTTSLRARDDVLEVAHIPPYTVFRLAGTGGYVEPLAHQPVRSSRTGWRDKAYRWFTRKPLVPVHLAFTDDGRFPPEPDEWLPPPAVPLEGGVEVHETVEAESITITTSRVGHPLLVKVSYHPRWRAEGADGPYLVSPALMMVVPRAGTVRLYYARTWADHVGLGLTLAALAGLVLLVPVRRLAARRAGPAEATPVPADACALPTPPRRWGAAVPAAVLAVMVGARFLVGGEPVQDPQPLYERASRAYAEERYAEAAEYARHALSRAKDSPLRAELLCLRGESLLRAEQPAGAREAFEAALREPQAGAYLPQALFGLAQAQGAAGNPAEAARTTDRLLREHPETPWARRAAATSGRTPSGGP
jgi:hypothetical protein